MFVFVSFVKTTVETVDGETRPIYIFMPRGCATCAFHSRSCVYHFWDDLSDGMNDVLNNRKLKKICIFEIGRAHV